MKSKLLNLFLDVRRFSVLTLANELLHDAAYQDLLTEVMFSDLRTLLKQPWVKTPKLATVIRNIPELL